MVQNITVTEVFSLAPKNITPKITDKMQKFDEHVCRKCIPILDNDPIETIRWSTVLRKQKHVLVHAKLNRSFGKSTNYSRIFSECFPKFLKAWRKARFKRISAKKPKADQSFRKIRLCWWKLKLQCRRQSTQDFDLPEVLKNVKYKPPKPNICQICGFDADTHRIEHIFREHIQKPTMQCPYCDFSCFYFPRAVKDHIRRVHKGMKVDILDKRPEHVNELYNLHSKCFPLIKPNLKMGIWVYLT